MSLAVFSWTLQLFNAHWLELIDVMVTLYKCFPAKCDQPMVKKIHFLRRSLLFCGLLRSSCSSHAVIMIKDEISTTSHFEVKLECTRTFRITCTRSGKVFNQRLLCVMGKHGVILKSVVAFFLQCPAFSFYDHATASSCVNTEYQILFLHIHCKQTRLLQYS